MKNKYIILALMPFVMQSALHAESKFANVDLVLVKEYENACQAIRSNVKHEFHDVLHALERDAKKGGNRRQIALEHIVAMQKMLQIYRSQEIQKLSYYSWAVGSKPTIITDEIDPALKHISKVLKDLKVSKSEYHVAAIVAVSLVAATLIAAGVYRNELYKFGSSVWRGADSAHASSGGGNLGNEEKVVVEDREQIQEDDFESIQRKLQQASISVEADMNRARGFVVPLSQQVALDQLMLSVSTANSTFIYNKGKAEDFIQGLNEYILKNNTSFKDALKNDPAVQEDWRTLIGFKNQALAAAQRLNRYVNEFEAIIFPAPQIPGGGASAGPSAAPAAQAEPIDPDLQRELQAVRASVRVALENAETAKAAFQTMLRGLKWEVNSHSWADVQGVNQNATRLKGLALIAKIQGITFPKEDAKLGVWEYNLREYTEKAERATEEATQFIKEIQTVRSTQRVTQAAPAQAAQAVAGQV